MYRGFMTGLLDERVRENRLDLMPNRVWRNGISLVISYMLQYKTNAMAKNLSASAMTIRAHV